MTDEQAQSIGMPISRNTARLIGIPMDDPDVIQEPDDKDRAVELIRIETDRLINKLIIAYCAVSFLTVVYQASTHVDLWSSAWVIQTLLGFYFSAKSVGLSYPVPPRWARASPRQSVETDRVFTWFLLFSSCVVWPIAFNQWAWVLLSAVPPVTVVALTVVRLTVARK